MNETRGCICGTDNGRHALLCPGKNIPASPAEQEYTPTEEEVDAAREFIERRDAVPGGIGTLEEFAAVLAVHDAEVRADEHAKRPDREQIKEALAKVLDGQEAMHCTRVWEAWSYNTMTADDFSLVAEDDAALEEIVDAVLSSLALEPEADEVADAGRTQHLSMFATMVADLDRNANGRHEGDYDSDDPTGLSQGNPHFCEGQVIGYSLHGTYAYVMPPQDQRHDPEAWRQQRPRDHEGDHVPPYTREVTDAEVEAAHRAFWASGDVTGGYTAIRAALEAAREVSHG